MLFFAFFCFFLRGESSFFITDESKSRKKRADVFSLEKEEHTKESRVEKSSRKHTTDFDRKFAIGDPTHEMYKAYKDGPRSIDPKNLTPEKNKLIKSGNTSILQMST